MKTPKKKQGYMCVGVVTGPHGIKGEVKIKPFTDDPFALTEYGDPEDFDGNDVPFTDLRIGPKGMVLGTLENVTDRNAAEKAKGTALYVPLENLPDPDEGEVYYGELVGMEIALEDGTEFGKVRDLYDTGANAVLVVRPTKEILDTQKDVLLPYIDGVVVDVNRAAKLIIVSETAHQFVGL